MQNTDLVYSTETGKFCPECKKSKKHCVCNPSANPKDGFKILRISTSSQGRKGKMVTLVKGLKMNPGNLKNYSGKLKKKTGTGGSVKNGIIELQGDFQEKIRTILSEDGWEVK